MPLQSSASGTSGVYPQSNEHQRVTRMRDDVKQRFYIGIEEEHKAEFPEDLLRGTILTKDDIGDFIRKLMSRAYKDFYSCNINLDLQGNIMPVLYFYDPSPQEVQENRGEEMAFRFTGVKNPGKGAPLGQVNQYIQTIVNNPTFEITLAGMEGLSQFLRNEYIIYDQARKIPTSIKLNQIAKTVQCPIQNNNNYIYGGRPSEFIPLIEISGFDVMKFLMEKYPRRTPDGDDVYEYGINVKRTVSLSGMSGNDNWVAWFTRSPKKKTLKALNVNCGDTARKYGQYGRV